MYAGIVAGGLALLALWLNTQPELNEIEPVYARTSAYHQQQAVPAPTPSPEIAPAAAPEETPIATVANEAPTAPGTTSANVTNTAASLPAPQETVASAPKTAVTNLPPAAAVPQEKAQPDFRLNGIIYSVRPSAIINGETVSVGDQVGGATVVTIGRTTVTLQINGQRKTCQLK
jgi:hypothetical protein